mmetsp:Transcript_31493/g.101089  ORF Transcript_31493/g.101089 Transcript_31493/m.101089 type:complete len:266 (-) Transcript_31493:1313-2110(-)
MEAEPGNPDAQETLGRLRQSEPELQHHAPRRSHEAARAMDAHRYHHRVVGVDRRVPEPKVGAREPETLPLVDPIPLTRCQAERRDELPLQAIHLAKDQEPYAAGEALRDVGGRRDAEAHGEGNQEHPRGGGRPAPPKRRRFPPFARREGDLVEEVGGVVGEGHDECAGPGRGGPENHRVPGELVGRGLLLLGPLGAVVPRAANVDRDVQGHHRLVQPALPVRRRPRCRRLQGSPRLALVLDAPRPTGLVFALDAARWRAADREER